MQLVMLLHTTISPLLATHGRFSTKESICDASEDTTKRISAKNIMDPIDVSKCNGCSWNMHMVNKKSFTLRRSYGNTAYFVCGSLSLCWGMYAYHHVCNMPKMSGAYVSIIYAIFGSREHARNHCLNRHWQIRLLRTNSLIFELKCNNYHTRIWIWKWRQNGEHFD